MSREEVKSVCNFLLSEESLTAEPSSPVSITNTTKEPREEKKKHDNSVNNLDE